VNADEIFKAGAGWRTVRIPLKCFAERGADMAHLQPVWTLSSTGPLTISFSEIELATQAPGGVCPSQP